MLKSQLGFGMMRLPVQNGDPADFDYAKINEMVDAFFAAGYTYIDTSYVYHNGKSEECVRKAVVERYPRDAFFLATKFPAFLLKEESQIEPIFEEQLANLGVDYVDNYLLHNIQTVYYDGFDGTGGTMKTCHLFDHAKAWLAAGKIRHLGISFHSSAKLLDRILTEHPEIEFVQIALNYMDWESELVQAGTCYEVIRKHGRDVIIMEPVKGGGLAKAPEAAERILKEREPEASVASWAVRFAGSLDGVIAVLSGMSTLEQVQDNIASWKNSEPLTEEERTMLFGLNELYRESGPYGKRNFKEYASVTRHGVPVSAILEAYNICQIQPDPGYSCDNNYFKNAVAEATHLSIFEELPAEKAILPDGTDITEMVDQAERWLIDHTF